MGIYEVDDVSTSPRCEIQRQKPNFLGIAVENVNDGGYLSALPVAGRTNT